MGISARQAFGLQQAVFRTRQRPAPNAGILEECVVHHVDAAGVWFTRPDFDAKKHVFGPAALTWPLAGITGAAGTGPHSHTIPVPARQATPGDRCLIAWVPRHGTRDVRAWCLGWSTT